MAAEVAFRVGFKGNDLWQAALKGDVKKVDKLVKTGADITFKKENKLMIKMVRELEQSNASDPAKLYYYGQIKLIIEKKLNSSILTDVSAGDVNRVRSLAESGADLYQDGKVIFQAIGSAKDSPEIVAILLCNNFMNEQYIEAIQPDGKTNVGYLLAEAQRKNNGNSAKALKDHINFVVVRESEAGNLPRIQALMKLGRDIINLNFKRSDGHTALMMAVMKKRVEVIGVLLSHGADVSQVNAKNKTARDMCGNDVRLTAMLDKVGMVKELREKIKKSGAETTSEEIGSYLDKGVQVNSVDADGNSILSLAVQYKCSNEVLMNLITTYHADPNVLNKRGTGPVEMALVYRDEETLKCLFEAGVNIKRGKNMLLQYAEANGFPGSVKIIKEELGKYLWKAVDDEEVEEIKVMLENCGAYVDEICHLEGYEGWTTLFLAAHKNNVEVAKLLCNAQANVDIRSEDGKTALSIAVQTGRKDVLLYLISEGASVNVADTSGNTPLLLAVKGGNLPLVQILLHAGANPYHEQGSVSVSQLALESSNKNIVYIFEHLDFLTAIPDWEESPSKQRPPPKLEFFRSPINFDPNPPQKVQIILRGNEKTNKKLMDAAKNGKPTQIKEAIAEGADIRYVDSKMKRPLQYAQEKLTKLNQEVLSPVEEKRRAQLTGRINYQDVVNFLTNKLNELMWNAVQLESLERVQTLHECGATLNWCAPERPLGLPGLLASAQDNPEIMSYLMHHCPQNLPTLRSADQQNRTLLLLAESKGFRKLASWIRAKMTQSLHLALANNDLAAAKQILMMGAGPEIMRSDGDTHLHQAVEMGDLELVQLLVKAGADCSVKHQGHSMADLARIKGLLQISRLLQQCLRTQQLFSAAAAGDLSTVQEQHLEGGHIDCQSYQGITPLKAAVNSGNAQLMHYLISRGASLVRSRTSVDPIGKLENLNYNIPLKDYIQRSVDEQFLASVIEGDMTKLEYLLQLGASIDYCNPTSKETAISLCINYHSVDLLKFLENRGSVLTSPADAKGNYALGIAASRGNTAVVEYLIQEININKTIRNHEGKTPLDIAQETDHQEVVRLLGGEVKEDKSKKVYQPPKYKLEELLSAVKNCNMTIIKEFIEEIYSRRDEKVNNCAEMMKFSVRHKQKEVEKKLYRHYQDLIEDTSEHKLTGSAESQVILTGFLRSLSAQITGYALDPNDPRSYDFFFTNMDEKAEEARKRILVDDLNQLKAQFQEDLIRVQEELTGLKQQRESMQARDREYFERIAQMKVQLSEEKSARERDRIRQEMITLQDDVKTLHAQQKILEAQENRQNKHYEVSKRFEATHINLLHFYRTVYLGVEEIFLGAKSVASGMTIATAGSLGKTAKKIETVSSILDIFKLDPLVGATVARVTKFFIKAGTKVMKDIDKYRQKEIGQYISCLATVGEQVDICTDVAYRLTLWYSDQITCLAEPIDASKTSICLHSPARRMAQITVGVIYSSLIEKEIETGKAAEFATLAEQLVWCVVAQKPKDGKIANLQERAAATIAGWKQKAGKGPTGTGYLGSKVPPNFVEVEIAESLQKNGKKTWMLRDIFLRCGIIDRDGNVYEAEYTDTSVFKYCYGTEMAATERSLKRQDEKKPQPKGDMFANEDVITVSSVGGASGSPGSGGQFHLAPGKIDERVHSILEKEKLDRADMENCWKNDISKAQEEVERRTDSLEERQSLLEVELRDKVLKIEEIAEEKTKLYEETFAKYQGQLLGKYNELKSKMEDNFKKVFDKMQADTRKEFETMQKKFSQKEKELDEAFRKSQEKLDARYAETERRLEEGAKKTAAELHEKSKRFCETLRKETVSNFQFAKEQLDQFAGDKIKEIIKIEKAAEAKFEAQALAYKKDSDDKTDMARKELINIMENRTTRHHKEMKEGCASNLSKMEEMAAKLERRIQSLEEVPPPISPKPEGSTRWFSSSEGKP
ncbi:uncharacterized protein LOC114522461 isoform X2 [Dendronephthya gigantea]|uniref:uncharacterized protein LOC114522461 isoform X2 n=1 Tax=Dendronephthya gigantea TaxID=151771 RepID=UPI00106CB341|nr:uncharacterized protein LOC114522461 isoform X2 [Dendronephthya gigantea]